MLGVKGANRKENMALLRHITGADNVQYTLDRYKNLAMSIRNTIVRRAKAFATKMLQGPVARDVEASSGGALSAPMARLGLALTQQATI